MDDTGGIARITPDIQEDAYCTCGYDLRITGHCGCGKVFQICLGCHLPTRNNRCTCAVKTRNMEYPEEWM